MALHLPQVGYVQGNNSIIAPPALSVLPTSLCITVHLIPTLCFSLTHTLTITCLLL